MVDIYMLFQFRVSGHFMIAYEEVIGHYIEGSFVYPQTIVTLIVLQMGLSA